MCSSPRRRPHGGRGAAPKNGGNKEASELDANFEFFELRARRERAAEPSR